ncbi:MAG: hypothetical protein E5V92_08675 [Mesorhizobium sp.]|nr:hypothetical protein EJ067_13735 [Mesorhizobium sp. M1D.F.Ca.ET.043.01.1.1]RWA94862.1 MAG: hypothetical protein EOQ32_10265 [Mesorhizobium sp.]RWD60446.1 MAG: hypothetical protein EOS36_21070 [Mesorhizobium sp.]RWE09371.1 MAG: hypothetical protein EOS61_17260 [Mesorhizobium sp.]RWE42265.1 MAG: hypothetical protein EOS79_16495 [Mesorhizobium sp.]
MPRRETLVQMAERHVREGEAIIARQRALIERLAQDGHPTAEAEEFLLKFMETQAVHVAHWERLIGQSNKKPQR